MQVICNSLSYLIIIIWHCNFNLNISSSKIPGGIPNWLSWRSGGGHLPKNAAFVSNIALSEKSHGAKMRMQ